MNIKALTRRQQYLIQDIFMYILKNLLNGMCQMQSKHMICVSSACQNSANADKERVDKFDIGSFLHQRRNIYQIFWIH